jgi:hypothetical protein
LARRRGAAIVTLKQGTPRKLAEQQSTYIFVSSPVSGEARNVKTPIGDVTVLSIGEEQLPNSKTTGKY